MAKQPEQQRPALTEALIETPLTDFERLLQGNKLSYTPSGETSEVLLSVPIAKRFFVKPTKKGLMPTDEQITQFVMTCKARELNPWLGDVWLVGYDTQDGPEFSLITSVQALHKRADKMPEYDGLAAGIVVERNGELADIPGAIPPSESKVVGGWCQVMRKDRATPFYASVTMTSRNKKRNLWNSDPEGMVRKCAVAAALREAFPNQNGGLYTTDELPLIIDAARQREQRITDDRPKSSLQQLIGKQTVDDEPADETQEPPVNEDAEPDRDGMLFEKGSPAA